MESARTGLHVITTNHDDWGTDNISCCAIYSVGGEEVNNQDPEMKHERKRLLLN